MWKSFKLSLFSWIFISINSPANCSIMNSVMYSQQPLLQVTSCIPRTSLISKTTSLKKQEVSLVSSLMYKLLVLVHIYQIWLKIEVDNSLIYCKNIIKSILKKSVKHRKIKVKIKENVQNEICNSAHYNI